MFKIRLNYRGMTCRIQGSFDEVMELLRLWEGRTVREFVNHMEESCA